MRINSEKQTKSINTVKNIHLGFNEQSIIPAFLECLKTLGITLVAVSTVISTEDKLYLSHQNSQNNVRKAKSSFSQYLVLESIRVSMKNAIFILINLA